VSRDCFFGTIGQRALCICYADNMTHVRQPEKILAGEWDANTSWEFYLGSTLPKEAICTSVSCLALMSEGEQIVLTHNRRGLEMLGGHVEPGETLGQTLRRESLEEGGFYPNRYEQYGYRRVSSKTPVPNDHHGGTYPPVTYIAHYMAETDWPLITPTAPRDEIFGRRVIETRDIGELTIVQLPFILAGLTAYQAVQAAGRQLGEL
jgi:8-oxo-dGTP pyrophosphatase MutT (NUDIX family)